MRRQSSNMALQGFTYLVTFGFGFLVCMVFQLENTTMDKFDYQYKINKVQSIPLPLPANRTCKTGRTLMQNKLVTAKTKWNCVAEQGTILSSKGEESVCHYTKIPSFCQHFGFQQISGTSLYSYSAFYTRNHFGQKDVLIIAMTGPTMAPTYCILTYKNGETVSVPAKLEGIDIPDYQKYFPVIPLFIKCPETRGRAPSFVSLSTKVCGPIVGNGLVVEDRTVARKNNTNIGICLKHIFNYKSPYSFVEWVEMQKIMGVNQIIMYDYSNVSSEMKRLINHYQEEDYLKVHPWKPKWKSSRLPTQGGMIHTHGQFAFINDCLHRYGNQFKYMLVMDPDEYIIPFHTMPQDYPGLIKVLMVNENMASRRFKHSFFCINGSLEQDYRNILITQTFTKRNTPYEQFQMKSIIRPDAVYMMGVHHPLKVYAPYIPHKDVPAELAKLHHYRNTKSEISVSGDTQCSIIDTNAFRYKALLQKRMYLTLTKAGITK